MKTIKTITVLILMMSVTLCVSAQSYDTFKPNGGKNQVLLCSEQSDILEVYANSQGIDIYNTMRVINTLVKAKKCSGVDGTGLKFLVDGHNDAIARIFFYNNEGQLMTDRPLYTLTKYINLNSVKDIGEDLMAAIQGGNQVDYSQPDDGDDEVYPEIDSCYKQKMLDFRAEFGEDAPVHHQLSNEWLVDCGGEPEEW